MLFEEYKSLLYSDTLVPDIFISEYMPSMDGDYVKVYLHWMLLSKYNRKATPEELAKKLNIEIDKVKDAFFYFESMGIITRKDDKIILNDLKKAGAQAISINGERIVAISEQVCAGPTILVNRNRYPVPYIINAIGDPDLLYESLSRSERIALMIEDRIRVEIKKSKEVIVPGFSHSDNLDDFISHLEVVNYENK